MTTFETRERVTGIKKYGIRLVTGTCLWFDTRDERDMYFIIHQ